MLNIDDEIHLKEAIFGEDEEGEEKEKNLAWRSALLPEGLLTQRLLGGKTNKFGEKPEQVPLCRALARINSK